MSYKYMQAESYGANFLKHHESGQFFKKCYPNDIWVVENNEAGNKWIRKVNGVPLTKQQAQDMVNEKITEAQQKWDTEIGPLVAQAENSEQEDIITVVNPRPVDMTLL